MKTKSGIWKFHPFVSGAIALIPGLLLAFGVPTAAQADGVFVAPQFVWDKKKDINEPTQKAIIMHRAGREELILQVKYEGPVEEFGWLIPVPALPTVREGSMECFYELSRFTQEMWEPRPPATHALEMTSTVSVIEREPVRIVEVKTVGAYDVTVLAAKDAGSLEDWLQANQFVFPANKRDVLEDYIRRQSYFIAIKINLSQAKGFQVRSRSALPAANEMSTTQLKLAAGELNPLHLSFASERCVFPLKISSVNGRPSEVQVYVLAAEPLLEKQMWSDQLPEIHRTNVARQEISARMWKQTDAHNQLVAIKLMGGDASDLDPPDESVPDSRLSQPLIASEEQTVPFAKVTAKELPHCGNRLPEFAGKSWWLTKRTWTFQPEDMRDLLFEPAAPAFAHELGLAEGYYAAACLERLGIEAVPEILKALQSKNPAVRRDAATCLDRLRDARLWERIPEWFKDPEPELRRQAIEMSMNVRDPKFVEPYLSLLLDTNNAVSLTAASALRRYREQMLNYVPVLLQWLHEGDTSHKLAVLRAISAWDVDIPKADVLPLFNDPQMTVVGTAVMALRYQDITCDEAVPLLKHPQMFARVQGLRILYDNKEKQSIAMAIPLLKDPKKLVRERAGATLRALTGQHFPAEPADAWEQWWAANQATFVVEDHPDELLPPHSPENDLLRARDLGARRGSARGGRSAPPQ